MADIFRGIEAINKLWEDLEKVILAVEGEMDPDYQARYRIASVEASKAIDNLVEVAKLAEYAHLARGHRVKLKAAGRDGPHHAWNGK